MAGVLPDDTQAWTASLRLHPCLPQRSSAKIRGHLGTQGQEGLPTGTARSMTKNRRPKTGACQRAPVVSAQKSFPRRTATDTCNRKPVNFAICLHVAECRECGQSAITCRSLELLRNGKEIVSLLVSRTQSSTSKRVLHPEIFYALPTEGGPVDRRRRAIEKIRREGLLGTS